MANAKRPGGLTALAVGNFVIGAVGAASTFAVYAVLKMANAAAHSFGAKSDIPGSGPIYASVALGAIAVALMLVAGYGYLKQRKLGRMAGNAYAVIGLANTIIALTVLHAKFGVVAILGIVWPLATLALINTKFRDNLVA